ncbi:hypothetical protein PMAYCL1PPCAC_13933, partial [Pristionchus mayeri]
MMAEDEESLDLKSSNIAQVVKRRRTGINFENSMNKSAKKKNHVPKSREIKCPECELGFHSCSTWISHLRVVHLTNPKIAGYLLRCDCG